MRTFRLQARRHPGPLRCGDQWHAPCPCPDSVASIQVMANPRHGGRCTRPDHDRVRRAHDRREPRRPRSRCGQFAARARPTARRCCSSRSARHPIGSGRGRCSSAGSWPSRRLRPFTRWPTAPAGRGPHGSGRAQRPPHSPRRRPRWWPAQPGRQARTRIRLVRILQVDRIHARAAARRRARVGRRPAARRGRGVGRGCGVRLRHTRDPAGARFGADVHTGTSVDGVLTGNDDITTCSPMLPPSTCRGIRPAVGLEVVEPDTHCRGVSGLTRASCSRYRSSLTCRRGRTLACLAQLRLFRQVSEFGDPRGGQGSCWHGCHVTPFA
jgi:hypothetical protein